MTTFWETFSPQDWIPDSLVRVNQIPNTSTTRNNQQINKFTFHFELRCGLIILLIRTTNASPHVQDKVFYSLSQLLTTTSGTSSIRERDYAEILLAIALFAFVLGLDWWVLDHHHPWLLIIEMSHVSDQTHRFAQRLLAQGSTQRETIAVHSMWCFLRYVWSETFRQAGSRDRIFVSSHYILTSL